MDNMFRQADKYVTLEDDVWAASQQVLVTNRPEKITKLETQSLQTTSLEQKRLKQDGQK